MGWNGSGQFNRTNGVFTGATVWDQSRAAGRTVRSDDHDTHDEDIATGLENTVTRDGQNQPSANLPMGGFRHTNVDDAVARTDYAAAGQIQDQGLSHIVPASVGGTGDAITLSPTPAITAYAAGQKWSFVAEATNTGAVTINVSALGTQDVQKLGSALVAADITTGDVVEVEYDGTQFQMLSPARTPVLPADASLNIGSIIDSNGNEVHSFAGVASAVNELTTTNAATGNSPVLSATGDDTDINLTLQPKNNGTVNIGGPLDTSDAAINLSEGAAVASATSTDIWGTDGNTKHITGTTTITGFGTAPRVGADRWVIFDGILTLTHGANLNLPGAADITTAAGDFARVYADTTTQFDVQYFRADGTAVVAPDPHVTGTEQNLSGATVDFTGISADAKRITLMIDRASIASGTRGLGVQIGDSGGIEATGYNGVVSDEAGSATAWSTEASIENSGVNTSSFSGTVWFTLMDAGTNKWHISSIIAESAGGTFISGGSKALTATLDRIRILTTPIALNAGTANILVEV